MSNAAPQVSLPVPNAALALQVARPEAESWDLVFEEGFYEH